MNVTVSMKMEKWSPLGLNKDQLDFWEFID